LGSPYSHNILGRSQWQPRCTRRENTTTLDCERYRRVVPVFFSPHSVAYETPVCLLYAFALVLAALTLALALALAMVLYRVLQTGPSRWFFMPLVFLLAPAGMLAALVVVLLLSTIVLTLRAALFGAQLSFR
jgi:hypothetical protein